MSSLSLSLIDAAGLAGDGGSFVSGSRILLRKQLLGADLERCSSYAIGRSWMKNLGGSVAANSRRFSVSAKIRKGKRHDYPWPKDIDPNLESGHLSYLSPFKPLTEKPKPVTLAFEKPLHDLEKKMADVRKMAAETGLDFTDQINLLESKYQQAVKDLYSKLTPIQRLQMARHPNRPTFLDHVLNITDKWVELHGNRAGYDDPAIVTGLGSIDGKTYMFIGHQKGRNTKENIKRNFGMPTPHGYRKALRLMRYADHHGFPIISFVDTPGAFADLKSEELGQGEAIAFNLREMFGLKVPMVSIVIGEGGSGGALAICCANKLLMLENSVFYVASPEACAAILWKNSQAAPKAAERLRITPKSLRRLKIADGIIPEPLGGAHLDPTWTSQQIKLAVMKAMEELSELDTDSLLHQRYMKYRILGGFVESPPVDPVKKRRMKKEDTKLIPAESSAEEVKISSLSADLPISGAGIEQVREEVDQEMTNAFISLGLQEELENLRNELSKSPSETVDPTLKERADRLVQEFRQKFDHPESFPQLKQKLEVLSKVNTLQNQIPEEKRSQNQNEKVEKLKEEINEKLLDKLKTKMEVLRTARALVASGTVLDADQIEAVEAANEELKEMLKSVNLEVVGLGKSKSPIAPPGLEEELTVVDKLVRKEIEAAVEKAGLRSKIDELKAEIASGSNGEKIEQLEREIKEEISAVIDLTDLKNKVASSLGLSAQEPAYAGNA
ncbi:acetyl-coenzyme A carboxylase carboxyl transferase subunit alpha, chloroplastic-like [Zingiber officinale]|uniref:acetyl-coenzyme A carboxylase carboxyl transferase subunit alpha, chloroplastic-like n=1 Tax=Zingiber officinale TaxID=94328 RepID=UPI001C4B6277|nr:acetyl-coenzyme A carboxylase carboxyl transferase subunit alpha, chloroplastic-like [Zingiber officinale]